MSDALDALDDALDTYTAAVVARWGAGDWPPFVEEELARMHAQRAEIEAEERRKDG